MPTFKLTIEYDGTDYHGWQVQPGLRTIQGVLEATVSRIVGKGVSVMGAGRTDAGVHAIGQVASLRASFSHPSDTLRRALTSVLPSDIVVRAVEEVDDDFHAQRWALWKRYRYTLLTRPYPSALECRYTLFVPYSLKIEAMTEAAGALIGTHDFSAFQAAHNSVAFPVRTILVAEFRQERDRLSFEIVADGFLRHMIRIMVGTLLDIGRGRLRCEDLKVILESKDRNQASKTIAPHALCLLEVGYHPFDVHLEKSPTLCGMVSS